MKKTPLHDRHIALGAVVVDFGGWAMPVQYTNVIEEHRTTREKAGLFDICHMGEFDVRGPQAFDLLQYAMSRNLAAQEIGQMMLCVMTNEHGGIIDDLTVYKLADEHYMVVTNAGTKDKDFAWLEKVKTDKGFTNVELKDLSDATGKLDFQGPKAQEILQQITAADLKPLKFYYSLETTVLGLPAVVSRSGYTGEDGFEIYIPWDKTGDVWDKLLEIGQAYGIKPIGLGARDTLRLECGMNLYGHEINDDISPLVSRYAWVTDLDKEFTGVEVLRKQKTDGLTKQLIGFEMVDRGIARNGYKIYMNGQEIGDVTSGTFAPTVNKAIGLGYVPVAHKAPDTQIEIKIRDGLTKARIVKLPFYKREK
jgi:aminomethyltransferase